MTVKTRKVRDDRGYERLRGGDQARMPNVISTVAGAVLRVVWYLDWRTGGRTVLDTSSTG
jgi:hypothetical protein